MYNAWLMAVRPRTLTLSAVPVMVGTAVAWAETGHIHGLATGAVLLAALFIQMATNLHNDAADYERGGDGSDRLGPQRVTAEGMLTSAQVKRGAWLCFGVAALAGLYLVAVGGWPILALGLASILAGWGYTGGPFPIAYTPLGEVFVLAFFGIGGVAGTAWLDTGRISEGAVAGGLALGLFASAVLLVNNHRDRDSDARVGRRTLALVLGPRATQWLYGTFLLAPFALLPWLEIIFPQSHAWLGIGALPMALRMIKRFIDAEGRDFNAVLGLTGKLQLVFALLLSLGLFWTG